MNSRRTPFDVFDVFDEMERAFDQMRRSMWGEPRWSWSDTDRSWRGDAGDSYQFTRDINLSVEPTDDGYVVLADLPGFEKEEIELRFDDGMLHISATHEVGDGEFARSRRVRESVSIAGDVVADDIEATYRNGVLEVYVPVESPEATEGHHIDIE
jgi:HSP20 family protein